MKAEIDDFGTHYTVQELTVEQSPVKLADTEGYTELFSKEIILRTGYEDSPSTIKCVNDYKAKVLRHELMHAIFHECGLSNYCDDETLVEFLAIQFPKIQKILGQVEEVYDTSTKNS